MRSAFVWAPGGLPSLLAAAALGWGCGPEPVPEPEAEAFVRAHEGEAFTFHRIRDEVYLAVGTGRVAVGANAAVVVNESDVLVVDSHVSPTAAAALTRELRALTDKPVRYVVNTHFHFDHVHGNQIYPAEVEIVSHELTRAVMASGGSVSGRAYERFVGGLPGRIDALTAAVDTASEADVRANLERDLAYLEGYRAAVAEVEPVPPTLTLSQRLTLFRGGREIRLFFFGRGHTGGDVVVHLPAERVLATGDLLVSGLPYMGDGYLLEWAATLEELKALDFDVVLPGHGPAFTDRERIDHLQAYLRDLWSRAAEQHAQGVPAGEAARAIDMRDHAGPYPNVRDRGVDAHAVERVYELLDGRAGAQ